MRVDRSLATFVLALGLLACKRQPPTEPSNPPGAEPSGQAAVIVEAQPIAPACNARSPRGALALVPETPAWLFHMNPREVMASELWSVFEPQITQGQEWGQFVGAFERCNFDWRNIEHVIVGVAANEDDFVGVLAAPGIGEPETARCLILELQAWAEDDQGAEVVPWPGDPSVAMLDFNDGRAYLFADDLVAIVTTAWQEEVGELSRCAGTPAIEGPTGELLARVDINAPLWLVARIGTELSAAIESALPLDGGTVLDATVSIRVDNGASLAADVTTSGPNVATTLADNLRMIMVLLPPELQPLTIEASGAQLMVRASVTAQNLRSAFEGL